MDRILRTREVLKLEGISRTTLWRWVRDGKFPAPVELGNNCIGWTESSLTERRASLKQRTYGGVTPEPDAA